MKTKHFKSAKIVFSFSLCAFAPFSHADLIAYWPFDEGVGEVAQDVEGGFDGTIIGGTWVAPGKVGAGAFQGAGNDEINCGTEAYSTTGDLTLAWWMVDNHENYGTIMGKSFLSSASGFEILVRPDAEDSPLRFRIGGWQLYGGWGTECRLPVGAYNDGEWVHIVCTYDSATDTASIYVNGELPANGALNPKTGIAGDGGYCDGVNNVEAPLFLRGGWEGFNGILDDVAIWDQALTPEEVMTVYTGGPLALAPGAPLAISFIDYSPGDGEVSLTWNSREGDIFTVKYSTDLVNWDSDIDDGVEADAGESTSRTFDIADLDLSGRAFFRVEKR